MYDFHTHFITPEVLQWLKEQERVVNAKWVTKETGKAEFLVVNEKWGFELKKPFVDGKLFLEEQEKAGVRHSLVSPIPQLFMYDFQEDITYEISSIYNQSLAKWTKSAAEYISALGTVPLNNPEKAADVLNAAVEAGLKGAIIGPGLADHMLSDEFFTPFFEEANRLNAIIFIHPLLNEDPRLKRRMMPNLIGVPWETTVCATDLLLSGMVDQFPKIKFLLAHGGGFLPYQIGRLNKGYAQWNAVSTNLKAPPSEYLKRFWYDSVLWNQDSLDFLIKTVGVERVVPGSDFPFDLSVWPPENIGEASALTLLNFTS